VEDVLIARDQQIMSDTKRKKRQRITVQDTLREILQPEQPGYDELCWANSCIHYADCDSRVPASLHWFQFHCIKVVLLTLCIIVTFLLVKLPRLQAWNEMNNFITFRSVFNIIARFYWKENCCCWTSENCLITLSHFNFWLSLSLSLSLSQSSV